MRSSLLTAALSLVAGLLGSGASANVIAQRNADTGIAARGGKGHGHGKIAPKVFILSMFSYEADVWYTNLPSSGLGSLFAVNISVPGASPLYPEAHCTKSGEICQLTVGEALINAASSTMALVMSEKFDLRKTYFMIAGIAGVSPKLSTLGGVALSKFAISVALQYEFDAREMPDNFSTGYFAYGTKGPNQYPITIYGTEVMEVNEALRDAAFEFASKAKLNDTPDAATYRAFYKDSGSKYAAAVAGPSVVKCDTAASEVYYSGALLSEAFENTTQLWTNQSSITYCMTAQEDTATLQVLMRSTLLGLTDYSRAILMRTGSDFDRPPPGISPYDHLVVMDQNGFEIALENIYLAGIEIVKGILENWECTYEAGVKSKNYLGDILGSLGGTPNFGPGSVFGGVGAKPDGSTSTQPIKRTSKFN